MYCPEGVFRSANLRREHPETGLRLSIHPQRHQQFEVPHPTEIKSIPEVQSFGFSHRIHSITRTHLEDSGQQGRQSLFPGPPAVEPEPGLLAAQDGHGVAPGQRLTVPAAAPTVLTGMRSSMGIAWLVIVAAEMLVGGTGIGYFVWNEWNNLSLTNVIFAILVSGVVGMLLDLAFGQLQQAGTDVE